jgi:hypothetical protein
VPVEVSGDLPEGDLETSFPLSAALEENRVYYWRARAFDGAAHGSWMETARFRFSAQNEPPSSPVSLEPPDGAVLALSQPTLVVASAADPESDALRYVFEILRDGVPVAQSPPIEEGALRTSWQVDSVLEENAAYRWRVVATDGALSSASSASFGFTIDAVEEPPSAPVPVSPLDGAVIETTAPLLAVENAASPDGPRAGPLSYHFALYRDPALTDVVAEEASVPEGNGTTVWAVPVALAPGSTYFWSARALDSRGLASDWAPVFQFTVEVSSSECPPEWRENFEAYPTGTAPSSWRLESEVLDPEFLVETVDGSRRLASDRRGRGAFLFVGNGEAFDWRNYEMEGELRQEGAPGGVYRTGVTFYARPQDGTSYRLELTSFACNHPGARIVEVEGSVVRVLGSVDLDGVGEDEPVGFAIETLNQTESTSIRARLEIAGEPFVLEVEDADAPLRSGTVGVWANFTEAAWDDLHVREVPGFASGISGDADGDGLCDVEDVDCETPLDVCLDEGYDPVTGLSPAVVARHGNTKHHGPTACGADHSYSVKGGTGELVVRTPAIAGGSYGLRLLVRQGADRKIAVILPDGSEAEVRSDGGEGPFVWSRSIPVALGAGAHDLRIRSIASGTVHVEGYRLEARCR